jgi:serine kinase of HPr protein (carbohydrate metabolism regulator)
VSAAHHVHASVVVVGESGILIEGPSGSGKSALAEALVAQAEAGGRFARLVGDDRIGLTLAHGRLIARPHPAIAGLVERRGTGIVAMRHEPACVLALAVALLASGDVERWPDRPPERHVEGVALPLLKLRTADGAIENSRRIMLALTSLSPRCTKPF